MRILAIETSCDETSIAIADFSGPRKRSKVNVFSHIVSSQVKLHAKYGGVVPNLAKREHQKNLPLILLQALEEGRFSISKSEFLISKPRTRASTVRGRQIPKSKIQKIEQILEREPELLTRFKKSILPLKPPPIDAIAVTHGPGLAPALWVGVNFARALAVLWDKPLIPTNHMLGHLYSALLQKESRISNFQFPISKQISNFQITNIEFPAIALLVSGGHTELVLMKGYGKYKIIGETLDDAAGEAFDKVARLLGLSYPGGPAISALAEADVKNQKSKIKNQNENLKFKIKLPRPMLNSGDYNFSFSGLKTAVLYLVRDLESKIRVGAFGLPEATGRRRAIRMLAKEFQDAVVEVLVKKTVRAAKEHGVKTVLLGGGVAANKKLRTVLNETISKETPDSLLLIPDSGLTGDNALMIAAAAYFSGKKTSPHKVETNANLRLP